MNSWIQFLCQTKKLRDQLSENIIKLNSWLKLERVIEKKLQWKNHKNEVESILISILSLSSQRQSIKRILRFFRQYQVTTMPLHISICSVYIKTNFQNPPKKSWAFKTNTSIVNICTYTNFKYPQRNLINPSLLNSIAFLRNRICIYKEFFI